MVRVRCLGVVFLGMATMHDQDGPIEPPQKVSTVGFDLELIDHLPMTISDHPVNGDDRIPFDAQLPEHISTPRVAANALLPAAGQGQRLAPCKSGARVLC